MTQRSADRAISSLEALLVVFQVNALHRHHQAHLVEAARVFNALTDDQRAALSITNWDPDEAYDRVERLFVKLCQVLDSGEAGIDATGFANAARPGRHPEGPVDESIGGGRRHRRRDLGCAARGIVHRRARR